MSTQPKQRLTSRDYLAWERQQEVRHEFFDGELYAIRGTKFRHDRTLPSLRDYLLVAQTECRVEHYLREAGSRWLLTEYRDLDDSIELTSVDCRLQVREIYERVPLSRVVARTS